MDTNTRVYTFLPPFSLYEVKSIAIGLSGILLFFVGRRLSPGRRFSVKTLTAIVVLLLAADSLIIIRGVPSIPGLFEHPGVNHIQYFDRSKPGLRYQWSANGTEYSSELWVTNGTEQKPVSSVKIWILEGTVEVVDAENGVPITLKCAIKKCGSSTNGDTTEILLPEGSNVTVTLKDGLLSGDSAGKRLTAEDAKIIGHLLGLDQRFAVDALWKPIDGIKQKKLDGAANADIAVRALKVDGASTKDIESGAARVWMNDSKGVLSDKFEGYIVCKRPPRLPNDDQGFENVSGEVSVKISASLSPIPSDITSSKTVVERLEKYEYEGRIFDQRVTRKLSKGFTMEMEVNSLE